MLLLIGLAVALVSASGCAASFTALSTVREDVERGRVDAHHVVFICHGMLKDFGSRWDEYLQEDLRRAGMIGIRVDYFCGVPGVWFNYGTVAPARVLAELADEITRLHERSGSPRPLILDAVGFSAGCEAVLGAASRARHARFRRVVLMNSSSFSLSPEAGRLTREGRIEELRNYWSPVDLVTILAPFGAGQFGLHFGGDGVSNHMTWVPHIPFLLGPGLRARIREFLREGTSRPRRDRSEFTRTLLEVLDPR